MNLKDAYNKLNLNENASADQVKAAFKELAQKYNPENYSQGPLYDDAKRQIQEVTEAFDTVMTHLRTGDNSTNYQSQSADYSGSSQYASVRQKLSSGNADAALAELNTISGGPKNAEWNFLVGSAYYHKGWVNDALRYYTQAVKLDPSNREYQNAMDNLRYGQNGNMHGNPYAQNNMYGSRVGCSCCDMCAAFMCMDLCCSCGGC